MITGEEMNALRLAAVRAADLMSNLANMIPEGADGDYHGRLMQAAADLRIALAPCEGLTPRERFAWGNGFSVGLKVGGATAEETP